MTIHFIPNDKDRPPDKLADVELHFDDKTFDGPEALYGLKLIGFALWQRKDGRLNVTLPARQYSVNGERRSYALVRPITHASTTDALTTTILDAWKSR